MSISPKARRDAQVEAYRKHMEEQGVRSRVAENIERHGIPVEQGAAGMNAVGSETGRVMRDAPGTSVRAATRVNAKSQRAVILEMVRGESARGMTGKEVGEAMMPPLVSSRTLPRLGEMWEEGLVYVLRERGRCVLGECHEHEKPRLIHRPCSSCPIHGRPLSRDGSAIWCAE